MDYADFHCHPGLKSFLSSCSEISRESCWKNIKFKGSVELVDTFFKRIFDSQSSLKQLYQGNVKIAIVSLYPIERALVTGKIKTVNEVKVDLLTISNFIKKLDYELLGDLVFFEKGYYRFFTEQKEHLLNAKEKDAGYNLVSRYNEIDKKKLNIILSIGGGHALFNDVKYFTVQEVLRNLREIKNDKIKYLYLTLSNQTQNPICNHAFAIDYIKHEKFKPIADGLSYLGIELIKNALDKSSGNRLFIDIKHMSLKSRLQYFELVNKEYPDVPVIASHVGVTGVSYNEMPVKKIIENDYCMEVIYKNPKGIFNTRFNPNSINLYDEEIEFIVKSGGIIGITLDKNLLGMNSLFKINSQEYFSKIEFSYYKISKETPKITESAISKIAGFFLKQNNVLYLVNNILHIIKVGGAKAWDHICLGSDFDGLIVPIKACNNSKKLKRLESKLIKNFEKIRKKFPNEEHFLDNIPEMVGKFMYGNVKRFLDIYFV